MAENPKRRVADKPRLPFNGYWLSLVKATLTTCVLGAVGFIGSWGIDTSKSIAQLHDQVENIKDKQDMLDYAMVDDLKSIKADVEKLKSTTEQIQIDLAKRGR